MLKNFNPENIFLNVFYTGVKIVFLYISENMKNKLS